MPSQIARSIVFDTQLFEMGSWTKDERALIETWICEDDFEEKRVLAANIIGTLIIQSLGDQCSEKGFIHARRIGDMLHHFEDLLIVTKSGIAKKFYRDHLNHMLRVTLLAKAIGNKMSLLALSHEENRMLTIAALVHDLAYPLAESYNIISEATKALKRCYFSTSFSDFQITYNVDKIKELVDLFESDELTESTFNPMLEKHDHGLMGCIEFTDYIKKEHLKENKRLFQSIAFHDGSATAPTSLKSDPILLALVLSDEIQDWGRPVGLDKESAISHVLDFGIDTNGIKGSFKWKKDIPASPLRQIYFKIANFKRFNWPQSMNLSLRFELSGYREFCLPELYDVCNEVINYCEYKRSDCIERLDKLWKESNVWFREFYGDILPLTKDLINYWKKRLMEKDETIYFNTEGKEVLHVEKKTGIPSCFNLEVANSHIKTAFIGEKSRIDGYLYSQIDTEALENIRKIVVSLILFHGLSARISSKGSGFAFRFPYPSKRAISQAMKVIGYKNWTEEMTGQVSALRRGIAEKGYFRFQS